MSPRPVVVEDDEFMDAGHGQDGPDRGFRVAKADGRAGRCGVQTNEEVQKQRAGEGDPGKVNHHGAGG